jgi:hypothetical protein
MRLISRYYTASTIRLRRRSITFEFQLSSLMARPYRRRAVSSIHRAYSHDPLERIEAIGGVNSDHTRWQLSQPAAIAAIEAGTDEFFVDAPRGPVKLVVLTREGQKYLQTEREKSHPDDLLNLLPR